MGRPESGLREEEISKIGSVTNINNCHPHQCHQRDDQGTKIAPEPTGWNEPHFQPILIGLDLTKVTWQNLIG